MNLKYPLLLLLGLAPIAASAQSALTIFSEDGDRFYLLLNGQKQNPTPQTNVHIDGLTQPYYSVKIQFEDAAKPAISKNVPVQDPQTNAWADVTYKIKKTNSGELKIRYFSATPVEPNYIPPPDMYVMHYGQQAPPPPPPSGGTTVTQTTVTTTNSTPPPAGVSMNMNAGGMNMNINVNDPNGGGGVNMNMNINDPGMNMNMNTNSSSQTTTTRTTTYTSSSNNTYSDPPPPPASRGCQYPMDVSSFRSAKETIQKASFEDTKLSTAKTIGGGNCFTTNQVIEICKLFSFEQTKLDFAKFAYDRTTDRGSYFKVGEIFSFDASKTELNEYISSGH